MSDHIEHQCGYCGSFYHHDDKCPDRPMTLSDSQIRVRIAEACGWKLSTRKTFQGNPIWERDGVFAATVCAPRDDVRFLPDYLHSLDAMDKAREHLESLTWPNGPVCPKCGTNDQARISKVNANPTKGVRAGLYCCKDCRRQFTVTTDSIFESTHIPLRKWLIAWYLLCSSKKGISSLQLQRMLDLGSYRSALFMTHRIRHALSQPVFAEKLNGTVEIDETYVGGRPRYSNNGKGDTKYYPKTAVVSMVQRNGTKRSMIMATVNGKSMKAEIEKHIEAGAQTITDDSPVYPGLCKQNEHATVNHSEKEYYRKEGDKEIHTNTAESSFSLLKRGIIGTFHHISSQHLPKYMAEFDHRWNTRHDSDTARTQAGIKMSRGKRLTYKPMVQAAVKTARVKGYGKRMRISPKAKKPL